MLLKTNIPKMTSEKNPRCFCLPCLTLNTQTSSMEVLKLLNCKWSKWKSLSNRSAFVLWQHRFWQWNIVLLPVKCRVSINTIARTIVFTCGVHHVLWFFCSCVNENIACYALRKQSTHTTYLPLFICWWLYMFRKRTQGFFLLCVSVWPPRGPWCQLRLSKQWIRTVWTGEGCSATSPDPSTAHRTVGW